ncbi:MAG: RidA family protein [Dehalococcoidales bacterium]|nr:RidA family protein [Dehalococcoidales bacterium]
MTKEIIQSEFAPKPVGEYSQAWAVTGGKLIFVAGQISVDMNGKPVGVGDMALQMRTVFENIKGVLKGAGASLRDVIKLNIYVTDMAQFREKGAGIRREYFPQNFPASTLVEVKSLASPDFMIEIEAIAAVG